MQYDSYQGKVKKVAAILSKVYAVRIFIIITLAAITALVTAAVAVKGLVVVESACPAEVVYGETPTYEASAILGTVSFEYAPEGSGEWSSCPPTGLGAYRVRAVSTSSFGTPRYGEEQRFTVIPREITPTVSQTRVTYGDIPAVQAATVYGDTIACGVLFEIGEGFAATAWVDAETVTVLDAEGNDRTDCYVVADTPKTDILFTPRPLQVTVQDADKIYDGVQLTFDGYEISGGDLVEGDTLVAICNDALINVGTMENTPELRVMGGGGRETTHLYEITMIPGTLTVEQRPLYIKTGSATGVYNGWNLTCPEYTIDPSTPLVMGHELSYTMYTGLRDCGSVENILEFMLLDENYYDVTSNYGIFLAPGTLTVTPKEITVYTEDLSVVYDGQPHVGTVAQADIAEDEFFVLEEYTSLRDVGSVENRLIVSVYRSDLYGSDKKDVTANYVIRYEYGTLTVTPRPITVQIANVVAPYDGTVYTGSFRPEPPELYTVENYPYPLVDGHTLTLKTECSVLFGEGELRYVEGSARIEGVVEVETPVTDVTDMTERAAQDYTSNYDITVLPGTLTVVCHITVTTESAAKVYDGEPLRVDEYAITKGAYPKGHVPEIFVEGSQTDVGESENYVDETLTRVLDTTNGNADVTAYYEITYEYGTLTVTPRPITVQTATAEKIYDGTPLMDTAVPVVVKGSLVQRHSLVYVTDSPDITDAGSVENIREAVVMHKGDSYVTRNYEITYEYGTLTVTPRPVTVQIPDRTWVFSGRPEEVTAGYTVSPSSRYGLVFGHSLAAAMMEAPPTYLYAGTYPNDRPAMVYVDETGEDMTRNYALSYVNGTVTIQKRPITIALYGEKIYDGTPLAGKDIRIEYLGEYALCEGHTLTVQPKESITDVGSVSTTALPKTLEILDADGQNVAPGNYTVSYKQGQFTVTPRPISVCSNFAVKLYDGTPLSDPGGFVMENEMPLVEGHVLHMNAKGRGVKVGVYENTWDVNDLRITNEAGVDKTRNYLVSSMAYGSLTVLAEPLSFRLETASDEKVYDGVPLECQRYAVIQLNDGTIPSIPLGYTVTVENFASLTEPGQIPNSAALVLRDLSGRALSDELLKVETDFGTLTVFSAIGGNAGGLDDYRWIVGQVRAKLDGELYLRQNSYSDFDGHDSWMDTARYGETLPEGYSYHYLTSIAMANMGLDAISVQYREMQIFLLSYFTKYGGQAPVVSSDTVDNSAYPTDYSANIFYMSNSLDLVSLYMKLSEAERAALLGDLSDEELAYREHVYAEYLDVKPSTRNFLKTIIKEQGFDRNDPEVIAKVASYVQHAAEYNADPGLAAELASTDDMIISFLRDYKEGLCRHYSATAIMIYRLLGIPARYTVGFKTPVVAGEWNEIISSSGPDNQAHAWVEIYLDGMGWVPVEVTGGGGGGGGGGGSGSGEGEIPPELPKLELVPVFCYKRYNGRPLNPKNELVLTSGLNELLRQGYTYSVTVTGLQTEVGASDSHIMDFTLYDPNGNDVTENYELIKRPGLLKVTKMPPVTVFVYPQEKTYDSAVALWGSQDYECLQTNGLTLKLERIHISEVNAGAVTLSDLNRNPAAAATFRLLDAMGQDVTDRYDLVFTQPKELSGEIPTLEIHRRVIELTAVSETRVYKPGGEALTNPNTYISRGSLVDGHTVTATAVGEQVGIGVSENIIHPLSLQILASDGSDMTDNYAPVYVPGLLSVIEKPE